LGNRLRNSRIEKVADLACRNPGASFPTLARGDESVLERIYRALNCPAYGYCALVEPHAKQTAGRMSEGGTYVVAHDTTECGFSGEAERAGLGDISGAEQGFLAHVSLALAANEGRRPLGVLGVKCWARDPQRNKRSKIDGRRRTGGEYAGLDGKESARWLEAVEVVEQRVDGRASIVHVMDREADFYALLACLVRDERRFVIRVGKPRSAAAEAVAGAEDRLDNVLEAAPLQAVREVPLSPRKGSKMPARNATSPSRSGRNAVLAMKATPVVLKRPQYLGDDYPPSLVLNAVYVTEVMPPNGEPPVEWKLLTVEPIAGAFDVLQIVDFYRARWVIEEYFRALKQGCALEKRQLESFHALTNALAIFVPIAVQLLLLRNLARSEPDVPATEVLSLTQLKVLRHFSSRPPSAKATVREAMHSIAALGGYLNKRGTEPGWIVLGRGYEQLLTMAEVWDVARRGTGTGGEPDRT
jgi:hypothetical protein